LPVENFLFAHGHHAPTGFDDLAGKGLQKENVLVCFSTFPYVCPEPVLVKDVVSNMAKTAFHRTCAHVCTPAARPLHARCAPTARSLHTGCTPAARPLCAPPRAARSHLRAVRTSTEKGSLKRVVGLKDLPLRNRAKFRVRNFAGGISHFAFRETGHFAFRILRNRTFRTSHARNRTLRHFEGRTLQLLP
jgi:hypothetical protein